jgi:hypothetical protein
MNEHARVARLLQHRLFGPPNRFSTLSQSTSTHSVRRKRMRHDPAFRSSAFLLMIAVAVFPRNGSLTLKAQDLAPSIYFTFRPLRCDDHARQMEGFPNYQFCAARSLLSSVFHGSQATKLGTFLESGVVGPKHFPSILSLNLPDLRLREP